MWSSRGLVPPGLNVQSNFCRAAIKKKRQAPLSTANLSCFYVIFVLKLVLRQYTYRLVFLAIHIKIESTAISTREEIEVAISIDVYKRR